MQSKLFDGARTVLYKPKRKRFMAVGADETVDSLYEVISDALGGGGNWKATKDLEFDSNNVKSDL